MSDLAELGAAIVDALPGSALSHASAHGELTLPRGSRHRERDPILRGDERCRFYSILDVTAIDWPARERRFIVYHLLSPTLIIYPGQGARPEGTATPVPLDHRCISGSELVERGSLDLYGVLFTDTGHAAGFSLTTGSKAIRCVRTFRSPALWKCAGRGGEAGRL